VLGCLPVGGPPAGQQLVHDRAVTCAFFTPSESEALPSHLFSTGLYRAPESPAPNDFPGLMVTELYAHPYSEGGGTAAGLTSLLPGVENVAPIQLGAVGSSPASDSLGRLFLTTLQDQFWAPSGGDSYSGMYGIRRYDPRTGTVGPAMGTALRFSPSRARVFVGDWTSGQLLDLQGSRALTSVNDPVFIGEDFYYVAVLRSQPLGPPSSSTLIRIKPNAEPEVLLSASSGSLSVTAMQGTQTTPQLLVQQSPAPKPLPGFFMLDLDTLSATPLPSDLAYANLMSASPSGRWLLLSALLLPNTSEGPVTQTMTLVNWATGARMELSPFLNGLPELGPRSTPEWRPGRDELWIPTGDGALKVVEPGDNVTAVALPSGLGLAGLPRTGGQDFSLFMPDGQHWFLRGPNYDGPAYVGSVDHPTLPPVQLNPQGTSPHSYWDIGDGRLLVGASVEDDARQELYLVDPAAGTSRSVAGGGQLVAVGKTRALALLEWDGGRSSGTLTLIELATGEQTVLAEDVYLAAVDPGHFADVPAGTDALASGTEVAFLSRGRFASPYDGLWVTRLP